MASRTPGKSRSQKSRNYQGEGGHNWILVAGGALLSTLSIRLGYKLKQVIDTKQQERSSNDLKGNGISVDRRKLGGCRMHSNMYSFTQDEDGYFNYISGNRGMVEIKHPQDGQMLTEGDMALPLVTVPLPDFNRENGVMWASMPERLELPPKPFHHSNCSDSPCVSESGSDIFSKTEVIQKLRQQLKRRDDMISEMQDRIVELQSSLDAQLGHAHRLQAQVDTANRDLFHSEREIQRLRKAIADQCAGHVSRVTIAPSEARNGHVNGYRDGEDKSESREKGRDVERIEMLKKEVGELKEVLDGKEYLLQSYKDQKTQLAIKVTEMQQRLDSHLPNFL